MPLASWNSARATALNASALLDADPRLFVWSKTVDEILESVAHHR